MIFVETGRAKKKKEKKDKNTCGYVFLFLENTCEQKQELKEFIIRRREPGIKNKHLFYNATGCQRQNAMKVLIERRVWLVFEIQKGADKHFNQSLSAY